MFCIAYILFNYCTLQVCLLPPSGHFCLRIHFAHPLFYTVSWTQIFDFVWCLRTVLTMKNMSQGQSTEHGCRKYTLAFFHYHFGYLRAITGGVNAARKMALEIVPKHTFR